MKLLIVEDQERLATMLKTELEREGFAVDFVTNGRDAINRILMYRAEYDLIILDLMLPDKTGFEICEEVRRQKVTTPILILTARDVVSEKVSLLNSGADDYLTKPFSFEELLARIRSILRRPSEQQDDLLSVDALLLDRRSHEVRIEGKPVPLTRKEFMLLEHFMSHPNTVITRDDLHDKLWDFNSEALSNTIDVHMANLRKKLTSTVGSLFETVRGVGYKFNARDPV